jgi:hypothetical protein
MEIPLVVKLFYAELDAAMATLKQTADALQYGGSSPAEVIGATRLRWVYEGLRQARGLMDGCVWPPPLPVPRDGCLLPLPVEAQEDVPC